jgi:hypothetical protein
MFGLLLRSATSSDAVFAPFPGGDASTMMAMHLPSHVFVPYNASDEWMLSRTIVLFSAHRKASELLGEHNSKKGHDSTNYERNMRSYSTD